MNHPFAQKQFHHQSYQNYNSNINSSVNHLQNQQSPIFIPSAYQNSQYMQNGFTDQDKENNTKPQYIPAASYQRPQYPACYLIPVPQQQNIPIFSHALYPFPIALNQPFIYPQQNFPPPPPGFNIPLQNQQQYFFMNPPPPPIPFNSHFTSQSSFHQQHQNAQSTEQNQYQEASDQQLPQFIDPNSEKAWKNDNTPTDDYSQSSFTPTTFSRDYIKKKLDFNSPLSIMSFKKKDSRGHRSSNPKSNKLSLQMQRRSQEHITSSIQKHSSLSTTVTPQKKKNTQNTLQLPRSDSKYDKKKWFGDRVNNIFDKVEKLQLSKFKEMNKECLSAEKAMKCIDQQLKIQK